LEYEPEELIPIIADLTDRYTGKESTSVSLNKARQLTQAVVYCIREYEKSGRGKSVPAVKDVRADTAYENGFRIVLYKTEKAQERFGRILSGFRSYGNIAYSDTVEKGFPEFFAHYDARFEPQENVLTLDYPVLIRSRGRSGIDWISQYLFFIELEQRFLHRIPTDYIEHILNGWNGNYGELLINICAFVYRNLMASALINRRVSPENYSKEEKEELTEKLIRLKKEEIIQELEDLTNRLINRNYAEDPQLKKYLCADIPDFYSEITNAVNHDSLSAVIYC